MLLSYSRNFFLQRILCAVCFCLCLLVLSLPFIDLEIQSLDLLPQLALILLGGVDILLELILQLLARGLVVGKIGLELFVLALVVF